MTNKDWWFEEIAGITLIRFRHFENHTDFKYFVTTRNNGNSTGPVASFNLGFQDLDLYENVIANRKSLADSIKIPFDSFVFAGQTHNDHIKIVNQDDREKGLYSKENAIDDTDGFLVSQPGICPVIMVADCVPVILYDPVKKVAGVFHAGWRGTVKRIAQQGLVKMRNEFGTNPSDVLVSIGPSIGACCYEVGEEVVYEVKRVFTGDFKELLLNKGKAKLHFDLCQANKVQLKNEGVLEEKIIICDACTFHNPEIFFSSRYSKGKTGRMGAGVYLD